MLKTLLFLCCCSILSMSIHAAEIHVGTAFHSLAALTEIARLFEKNSANKVIIHQENLLMAKLYKQIKEKNDLDLMLSSDLKTASQLVEEGLVNQNDHFTYALGRLVLWSKDPVLVDNKGEVLSSGNFRYVASLDPKIAPYGLAAQQVLEKLGLRETLQAKWFFVSDVREMQQQVREGKIDLAFIALTALDPSKKIEGSLWIIPQNYYVPLEQQVVLLKKAENNAPARAFFNYLKSPQARNIFEKYGFNLP